MTGLPVRPPVAPMLGRLARDLPVDGFVYEPKWDGFRCLAFCCGDEVDLRSRHDRPFSRYFPELVEALSQLPVRSVLDGEIMACVSGRFDFTALLGRLHPAASRVERLARETPARFVTFDLLALGDEDLRARPFAQRRQALEELLAGAGARGPVHVTPATGDVRAAQDWLERFQGAGIDGVIAKHRELRYEPGARAMVKVKPERTADCVVAGLRLLVDKPLVSSLLLGLYDDAAELRHVGVCTAFSDGKRRELLAELAPHAVPLAGHPWERGFLLGGSAMGRLKGAAGRWDPDQMALDWVPLAPTLVCEVSYDHVDADRFRHPARFKRWRPDREARSCLLEQLQSAPHDALGVLEPR